jgi:hypothetical protein
MYKGETAEDEDELEGEEWHFWYLCGVTKV